MVGVPGIHTTDCIFVLVVPTPLVAGILYGTTRNVGNNEVRFINFMHENLIQHGILEKLFRRIISQIVLLDGDGASYDPDVDDPPSGGSLPQNDHLEFLWSYMVPVNSFGGTFNSTEKELLFGKLGSMFCFLLGISRGDE